MVIDVRHHDSGSAVGLPPPHRRRQLRADVGGNQARDAEEAKDDQAERKQPARRILQQGDECLPAERHEGPSPRALRKEKPEQRREQRRWPAAPPRNRGRSPTLPVAHRSSKPPARWRHPPLPPRHTPSAQRPNLSSASISAGPDSICRNGRILAPSAAPMAWRRAIWATISPSSGPARPDTRRQIDEIDTALVGPDACACGRAVTAARGRTNRHDAVSGAAAPADRAPGHHHLEVDWHDRGLERRPVVRLSHRARRG